MMNYDNQALIEKIIYKFEQDFNNRKIKVTFHLLYIYCVPGLLLNCFTSIISSNLYNFLR